MKFEEEYSAQGDTLVRTVRIGSHVGLTRIQDLPKHLSSEPVWSRWWRSFLRGAIPSYDPLRRRLNVVDLFGGCGGLGFGVREAVRAVGMESVVVAVADMDEEGLEVYAKNLSPRTVIHADLSLAVSYQVLNSGREASFAYPPELLNETLKSLVGQVDIVIAGPPCEGHSNLNNQTRRNDPRNLLYLDAVAVAVALRPKAIIIENVPDVVNDHKGVVQTGIGLLQKAGYFVNGEILSAHDLGLPQTRRRYFLVGVLEMMPSLMEVEAVLGGRKTNLAWAIKDLKERGDPLHVEVEQSTETRRRIDWLFDNKEWDLPDKLRPDCHKGGHTYGSVYGRLSWNEPSGTITTGFLTMGRGRFVHPSKRRTLTPREAARIQGFPDSFDFSLPSGVIPSRKSLTKWIGDAVPPIMGYAAAMAVLPAFVQSVPSSGHPVSKATQARMRAVRRANTSPEATYRKMLRDRGIVFETNKRDLPGTPDFVFRDAQVALFVHGCYWHRHANCELSTTPKTNVEFWMKKFAANKARDKRNVGALRSLGWRSLVVWQCRLQKEPEAQLQLVLDALEEEPAAVITTAEQVGSRSPKGRPRKRLA